MKATRQIQTSIALVSAAVLAVGTQFAGAVPTMRVSDGTTSIDIIDQIFLSVLGQAPDGVNQPGVVMFAGSIGSWTLTVDTGITMPASGTPTSPFMDLNFIATSKAPGTLTIEFSEIGFGPLNPGVNFVASIGGTTQGSITSTTLLDVGNSLFGGNSIVGPLTFGGPSYSDTTGGPGSTANPFSLTQRIVVTHGSGTMVSSGDAQLTVPDGGTTMALFGISLLGLCGASRRFGKA